MPAHDYKAPSVEEVDASSTDATREPLACVSCRARKLKCDRTKPACARCTKVDGECVYPESRRKPTYKRRNVKELEARLAQVETLLSQVNGTAEPSQDQDSRSSSFEVIEGSRDDFTFELGDNRVESLSDDTSPPKEPHFAVWNNPLASGLNRAAAAAGSGIAPDMDYHPIENQETSLVGLGLNESLPPWEVIEELTNSYFKTAHYFFPIIHPGRYLQAFYGGPFTQPPMALQYSLWAIAAVHHDKYSGYSDIFYKRAHSYIAQEEMKGDGEHFINIQHAQALGLLASYEAKRMLFTRASMNCAKYARIVHMMALDRMDTDEECSRPPTLSPPTSWIEQEERRRVFWGAFAIDAHASVSTGWPSLINADDATTRLPSSEEAFREGKEETTCLIQEAYEGAHYSSFAGTLVTCNMYKEILHLVHRPMPNAKHDDVLNGNYWKKHRELDNKVLTLFMFLPEHFRLSDNPRDAAAVHLNMNLHATVICLHHAAIDKAAKHKLPEDVTQTSIRRMVSSAAEIAAIAKASASLTPIFKSPLCALSLYSATTVYVYMAKRDPVNGLSSIDLSNCAMIIRLMEAISRFHEITKAFLLQTCKDIEANGLSNVIRMPALHKWREAAEANKEPNFMPLITRTSVAAPEAPPAALPFPGRLPGPKNRQNPFNAGRRAEKAKQTYAVGMRHNPEKAALTGTLIAAGQLLEGGCFSTMLGAMYRNLEVPQPPDPMIPMPNTNNNASHKRKRTEQSPAPDLPTMGDQIFSNINTANMGDPQFMTMPSGFDKLMRMTLPNRSGSSAASSPAPNGSANTARSQNSGGDNSSHTSPSMSLNIGGLGNSIEENTIDLRPFQGRVATPLWNDSDSFMFGQMSDEMVAQVLQDGNQGWGTVYVPDLQWPEGPMPNL